MIRAACAVLLTLCLVGAGQAQDLTVGAQAQNALDQIATAREDLALAESARDRVRALTDAIRAFEAGQAALRSQMLQVAAAEQRLYDQLQEQDAETAGLIAGLHAMAARPASVLLLHPGGAAGGVRAALLLEAMTPQLDTKAHRMRRDLENLQRLATLRRAAETQVEAGIAELTQARSALTEAIAARAPLPKRFTADPVREAILLSSAGSLREFAEGLDQIAPDLPNAQTAPDLRRDGQLSLPVAGLVLKQGTAGERPGITVRTAPEALVTSPLSATLRYVGPLLDLGQVVILEPQAGLLFVFAGLETTYGTAGDVVQTGAPLGLMGDGAEKNAQLGSTDGDGTSTSAADALYIEVRQDNLPEDPGLWFQTEQDG